MNLNNLHPINNYHLVQLEDVNAHRLIHLGGQRSISSVRSGTCTRSDLFRTGAHLLISRGGIPVPDEDDYFLVPGKTIISVDGELREPYVHIQPIELIRSELIITPEIYNWSGWYKIIDIFPAAPLSINDVVLPLYGTPRLELEDDTEYVNIDGIGVVEC